MTFYFIGSSLHLIIEGSKLSDERILFLFLTGYLSISFFVAIPLKRSSGEILAISVAFSDNCINDFSSNLLVERIQNFFPLNTLIPILKVLNSSIFSFTLFLTSNDFHSFLI